MLHGTYLIGVLSIQHLVFIRGDVPFPEDNVALR